MANAGVCSGLVSRGGGRVAALLGLVLASVVALAGCTSGGSAVKPEAGVADAAHSVEIPRSPVGSQVRWVHEMINADADPSAGDIAARLHEEFLAEVPAEEIVQLFAASIRPARPFIATSYEERDERTARAVFAGAVGEPFALDLAVDADGMITEMFLGQAGDEWQASASLAEVEQRIRAFDSDVRALVLRESGAGENEVLSIGADEIAPLGSMFKLYVLAAVAGEVAAGGLSWDDTLSLSEGDRSLPTGTLQDEPVGTAVTVLEAATQMIAISDNTATDLLMRTVGRDRVEQAVKELRHGAPGVMRPMLTTREAFQLSYGGLSGAADAAELRGLGEAWPTADEGERRSTLNRIGELPLTVTPTQASVAMSEMAEPPWTRDIEWYASPADIASAHRQLAAMSQEQPELVAILGTNSGLGPQFDSTERAGVAFKGGGNVGVLAGSWRVLETDGTAVTVVLMFAGEDAAQAAEIAQATPALVGLASDIFRLVE